MNKQEVLGIIPARYASTRFPGKPLALLSGKTMIRRVYEQAARVLDHLLVATDDERIRQEVESFGGSVCMTSPSHRSGTDRCAEALEIFCRENTNPPNIVVNIQGDEPFIRPEQIREILSCFDAEGTEIATLARPASSAGDLFNPNQPKLVINLRNEALLFSRSPVPFLRNEARENWINGFRYLLHVGMYAYRSEILRALTKLESSPLEQAESLEQLRWLENGYRIRVGITEYPSYGIDSPEDLENALRSGLC